MKSSEKKLHTKLYYVMLIFVVPIIISWLLYAYHGYFQFKTSNHGILIKPLITAEYFISTHDKKLWRILYVNQSNQDCDNQCKKIVYDLHQVQTALGKDYQRIAVIKMNEQNSEVMKLKLDFVKQQPEFVVSNKIYLIDPLGNVFMYYPSMTNPMNILKDIKKVLEVSQIG